MYVFQNVTVKETPSDNPHFDLPGRRPISGAPLPSRGLDAAAAVLWRSAAARAARADAAVARARGADGGGRRSEVNKWRSEKGSLLCRIQ